MGGSGQGLRRIGVETHAMGKRQRRIFENRAVLEGVAGSHCDNCDSPLIFALECGYVKLPLDLMTVMRCLKVAEERSRVPELPNDWWMTIWSHYGSPHLKGSFRKRRDAGLQAGRGVLSDHDD